MLWNSHDLPCDSYNCHAWRLKQLCHRIKEKAWTEVNLPKGDRLAQAGVPQCHLLTEFKQVQGVLVFTS